MNEYLFLIPLLPLIGFLVNGLLLGRLSRRAVSTVACGSVGLAFLLSVSLFLELKALAPDARAIEQLLFTWIPAGSFSVDIAFLLDPLSAIMMLVVTGVGFLIHVYSIGYMAHDKSFGRYFAYLNLFTFSMLLLVMANNYLLMFVGWEGVGLCSYLLIGFWFERKSATDAGKKAFIVNRIGDFAFLLGLFILFWQVGSLDFATVNESAATAFAGTALVSVVCLLFFIGAAGKSAQIPLYVWLPDAMEGPTPVSALIHAATMVTAGVYMIVRSNVLYMMAPDALFVVAVVGACTALFAATIGVAQNDIKKVLAYSTISQLGYMFLACGVAAFSAGIFHLMTHAFFKALLFLGAGSVIHAMSDKQDMRIMGGLKKHMPITYITFLIATLAITGIPFFSGFFSKDEILWMAFSSPVNGAWYFWAIGYVTAGLTAFYMFRVLYMTFHGEERMDAETRKHIHESPRSMTIPLMVLAALAAIGGLIGMPHIFGVENVFDKWLTPVISQTSEGDAAGSLSASGFGAAVEWGLMTLSVLLALLGWLAARYLYQQNLSVATRLHEQFSGLQTLLVNKYYVDEIYSATIVRPVVYFSLFLWKVFDVVIIDGIVNGLAALGQGVSDTLRYGQTGRVRTYAAVFSFGVLLVLAFFLGWVNNAG